MRRSPHVNFKLLNTMNPSTEEIDKPMFTESEAAKIRRQYTTEGCFLLPGVISPVHMQLLRGTCSKAVEEMDAEIDRKKTMVLGINHKGKRYFVGQAYRNNPELADFLFSDLMAAITQLTLGDNVYLHNDQFVVKSEMGGMKFSWHQDGAYVQARVGDHPECITCWCSMDDVSEANGTIYVLPASRYGSRKLVEHVKDPQTNDRVGYFGSDPGDPVTAPAGSIAVFSSTVFHRSGPNPSGQQRRAYLAQYAPSVIQNEAGKWPQYFAEPFLSKGRRIR